VKIDCRLFLTSLFVFAFFLANASRPASAQDWAREMFERTSQDFGVVARGSIAECRFRFTNRYREEVHVASVTAGCGFSAEVTQDTLKSRESAQIIVRPHTAWILGTRSKIVTVWFDRPFFAQVQLRVTGMIRQDIVVVPGAIEFGRIEQRQPAEQRVKIEHAGRADWKITDIRTVMNHVQAELIPDGGEHGGETVKYELVLRLDKDAPLGDLEDTVAIITDDEEANRITLAVKGKVIPSDEGKGDRHFGIRPSPCLR
jgi:hypothetical protein